MLKLIFKNLWARRRRNGWLFAELILVSIVTWVIFDPVVVLTHDRDLPLGYDSDRLALISLASLPMQAAGYDPAGKDSTVTVDNFFRLIRKVTEYPDVEMATPVLGFCYPNSQGNSTSTFKAEGDTANINTMIMYFMPHTHFFETFDFKGSARMNAAQLSDHNYTQNEGVITETFARTAFHIADAGGKRLYSSSNKDTTYMSIIGTVKPFKAYSSWRPTNVIFKPQLSINTDEIMQNGRIAVRLKEGVSMDRFLHDFKPWMVKEMKAGNLFARTVKAYDKIIADREFSEGVTSKYRMNTALALFFMVNLCLGVIGTFWMQTRVRREEVGVMLSFGATPRHIMRLLMGEGIVLTTIAVLVGCLLYLQYAIKEGLYMGDTWMKVPDKYWVSEFAPHFLVLSVLVYLVLLAVVLIGIYIPARRISRIPPTEALRDE